MARQIALLRGINLGSRNRVAMPALRDALGEAGFENVRTYVQSGNIVLDTKLKPAGLEARIEQLIAERFGLEIAVVVRDRDELAKVVELNPLAKVAKNPKRYQVAFLSAPLAPEAVEKLEAAVIPPEELAIEGREIYSWHAEGIARSKLWNAVASKDLGVKTTARNWTTVTTLLQMADDED
jgi:uncharacterized protein (DUF1697 family)